MVEVPKELQKFNMNVVYCGTQPDTHNFLVKRIAQDIITEELIEKYGEEKAKELIHEFM